MDETFRRALQHFGSLQGRQSVYSFESPGIEATREVDAPSRISWRPLIIAFLYLAMAVSSRLWRDDGIQ